MSQRLRVWMIVGAAAAAAAGITIGVTLATRSDVSRPRSKPPPFVVPRMLLTVAEPSSVTPKIRSTGARICARRLSILISGLEST